MKMKPLLAAAALALATPAFAADLAPRYAEPVPPVALYSWTGFYIGANVGYGWGNTDFDAIFPTAPQLNTSVGLDPDGFAGGIQLGYNYQWDNNFLLGIEADISFSNLHDGVDFTLTTENLVRHSGIDIDYFGTLRARAGITFDNVLLYATGGLLWVNQDFEFRSPAGNTLTGSSSDTSLGWVVGAGLEYALDHNWSIKAEYLYGRAGRESFTINNTIANRLTYDTDLSVVRFGINYKF